jgi:hypothetical protein
VKYDVLTLTGEHKLLVFGNKVLRKICGPKGNKIIRKLERISS